MKIRIFALALIYLFSQVPEALARNPKPPKSWFSEWDFYLDTSYHNELLGPGYHFTPQFTIRSNEVWLGGCFKSETVQNATTIIPAIWQIQTAHGPGVARVYGTRAVGIPFTQPTDVSWKIVIPSTVKAPVRCSLKKGALIGKNRDGFDLVLFSRR